MTLANGTVIVSGITAYSKSAANGYHIDRLKLLNYVKHRWSVKADANHQDADDVRILNGSCSHYYERDINGHYASTLTKNTQTPA